MGQGLHASLLGIRVVGISTSHHAEKGGEGSLAQMRRGAGRHDLGILAFTAAAAAAVLAGGISRLRLDGTEDVTGRTTGSGGGGGLVGGNGHAYHGLQTGLDLISSAGGLQRRQHTLEQSRQRFAVGTRRRPKGDGRSFGEVGQQEEGCRIGRGALSIYIYIYVYIYPMGEKNKLNGNKCV